MPKINFTLTDEATGLALKDALVFTDAEFAALSPADIDAIKAQRLESYVAAVTAVHDPDVQALADAQAIQAAADAQVIQAADALAAAQAQADAAANAVAVAAQNVADPGEANPEQGG